MGKNKSETVRKGGTSAMNLLTWVALIFAAHLLMYYALGTPSWFVTSILATLVWAAVLVVGSALFKQKRKGRV
jgi:membrane protein YdbS with pleckstrin-like domain